MENDEESLFSMQNIHVYVTQRSFIPHGGIQDDSFLIATQSLRRNDGNRFFFSLTTVQGLHFCGYTIWENALKNPRLNCKRMMQ